MSKKKTTSLVSEKEIITFVKQNLEDVKKIDAKSEDVACSIDVPEFMRDALNIDFSAVYKLRFRNNRSILTKIVDKNIVTNTIKK